MTSILDASTPEPDATFTYAAHPDGIVDLHFPAGGSGPLLFLIHGGFWKHLYDRLHTRPMARAFADRGFVVATAEYRRVGGGGGWPTTYADIEAAYAATLQAVGDDAGIVTGHSAGGHLALLLAAGNLPVLGAVPLAPVCDLDEAIRLDLGNGAAQAFLAGSTSDGADPMRLAYDQARVTIVHGRADDEVPIGLSRGFLQRHPQVRLVEIEADHYEPIDPDTPAFTAYADEVQAMTTPSR